MAGEFAVHLQDGDVYSVDEVRAWLLEPAGASSSTAAGRSAEPHRRRGGVNSAGALCQDRGVELKATRFEVDGPVATVWLDRPQRHNAWTGRMHAEYRWVLAELAADERVRAVVLTGTPPAFCVGADSDALAGHAERGGYDDGLRGDLARPGYGVRPELDHDFAFQFGLPFALIAAVNGAAAGVGLAVALFCDLRFVAATAKLTTAAPKLGLPAEFGMSWMLPRLVGVTRAADLLFSGRVVTGEETAEWGLWNGVLPTAPPSSPPRGIAPPRWPRRSGRRPSARPSASSTTTC